MLKTQEKILPKLFSQSIKQVEDTNHCLTHVWWIQVCKFSALPTKCAYFVFMDFRARNNLLEFAKSIDLLMDGVCTSCVKNEATTRYCIYLLCQSRVRIERCKELEDATEKMNNFHNIIYHEWEWHVVKNELMLLTYHYMRNFLAAIIKNNILFNLQYVE